MLSRIPTLSGLFGDEAKLAFRNQSKGITKLWSHRHISENDSYWDQYAILFDSAQDVFSLVLPHDVRRALQEAPENVATLTKVISNRLINLVSDHTFPTPSGAAFFSASLLKLGERNTTKEALNCIRLLQRVLPIIFETDNAPSDFETNVLWSQTPQPGPEDSGAMEPQFVIADDEEDEDVTTNMPSPEHVTYPSGTDPMTPSSSFTLAARLLACLVDLLFCCGFTVPNSLQVDHHKINYTIWEPGIGSSIDTGRNSVFDSNKTEVLRLLLILFSRQIYVSPSLLLTNPSLYTLHFVQQTPRRHVLAILCSLLNTAFSTSSPPMNIIDEVTGKLPYNHLVFKTDESRVTLISTTLQVLCVTLDFQSGTARDLTPVDTVETTPSPTTRTNAFRYFLAKLHRHQDFGFLITGISTVLREYLESMKKILPGSRRKAPYISECVVVLWRLVEINTKFRSYLLSSGNGVDLMVNLLSLMSEIQHVHQQHGVRRIISYIMQALTAEPIFGAVLKMPVTQITNTQIEAPSTFTDIFVATIYSTVTVTGPPSTVYPGLILSLVNASPHMQTLSVLSSARLLQMFKAYSDPAFLLADEGNPRFLYFMLEALSNIVKHHSADNPHLVYGILAAHRQVNFLTHCTLASAVQEIRRQQSSSDSPAKSNELVSVDKGKGRENHDFTADQKSGATSTDRSHVSLDSLNEEFEATRVTPSPATSVHSEKIQSGMPHSTNSNEGLAGHFGRNGFVPTEEWVSSWQKGLPLDTISILIAELLPHVRSIQRSRSKAEASSATIAYLATVSLNNLFPNWHSNPRPFAWSDASLVWLTSYIWGEIYARNATPFGPLVMTNIRLFQVKQMVGQTRPLIGAVSQVVGDLIGRPVDTHIERRT